MLGSESSAPTLTPFPKEQAVWTLGMAFPRVSTSRLASLVITQPLGSWELVASSVWCNGLAVPPSGLINSHASSPAGCWKWVKQVRGAPQRAGDTAASGRPCAPIQRGQRRFLVPCIALFLDQQALIQPEPAPLRCAQGLPNLARPSAPVQHTFTAGLSSALEIKA